MMSGSTRIDYGSIPAKFEGSRTNSFRDMSRSILPYESDNLERERRKLVRGFKVYFPAVKA